MNNGNLFVIYIENAVLQRRTHRAVAKARDQCRIKQTSLLYYILETSQYVVIFSPICLRNDDLETDLGECSEMLREEERDASVREDGRHVNVKYHLPSELMHWSAVANILFTYWNKKSSRRINHATYTETSLV